MEAPRINVTPLIDVLLVLLIIFMVVTPLKPSHFNARIPSAPDQDDAIKSHPDTLIVSISMSGTLALNNEEHIGSVDDPRQMTDRLRSVFDERVADAARRTHCFCEGSEKRTLRESDEGHRRRQNGRGHTDLAPDRPARLTGAGHPPRLCYHPTCRTSVFGVSLASHSGQW
jgi:biopolymer transport protein ExbD